MKVVFIREVPPPPPPDDKIIIEFTADEATKFLHDCAKFRDLKTELAQYTNLFAAISRELCKR